jgi:catechol 2,3-dioxygenase-like lactoylglutathione lyase family enzyme
MTAFKFDHVHLRSPDPDATAAFYERMFDAEVVRTMQGGKPRVDVNLGGQMIFIARVGPDDDIAEAPETPHMGLEHLGLIVSDIDAVTAELKTKGAEFSMEPTTIRPGTRIAFLTGPENVSIELVDRNA